MTEDEIHPPSLEKTQEWITALAAAGIPFALILVDSRWVIVVDQAVSEAARREIQGYEEDNRDWPPRPVPGYRRPGLIPTWAGFWGVHLLLLFSIWIGPYNPALALCRAGAAQGRLIAEGEWWRAVTALMLHSGPVHLAGNILFLLLLGQAVCRRLGPGLGWLLMLVSGVAGNLASAFLTLPGHTSVGASTACFGAVGILAVDKAVDNFRRFREWRSIWSRTWIPLGAGVAMLALTGVGEGSDLLAHAMGLAAGMVFAVPATLWGTDWLSKWGQRVLAGACLLFVACAWWLAWLARG
jgi:membrane associated rhomboid family serine protease